MYKIFDKKRALLFVLVLLGAFILAVLGIIGFQQNAFFAGVSQDSNNAPIKLGVILPLTGDAAFAGANIRDGVLLAGNEINQSGGIKGRTIKVYFEDDYYDNTASLSAANKLINVDKIDVGIVSFVHGAKAVASVFEQNKIPLVVAWDSTNEIAGNQFICSTGFSTEAAGQKMADFAFDKLSLKRVAVIFHDDEWSGIIAPSFVHEFEEKGGEIVMQERVAVGESDFKTIIQKAKGLSPDGVYLPFVPVNTDIFLKQAKEMDLNAQILSGDALIPEIVQAAGSTAEGIYFTNIYDGDNEVSNKLKGLYFREFGHEPSELPIVSFGYDAVQVIKKAIENTSTQTPKEIAAALRSINIFGAGGWIKMDSNCLANRVEKIYQIRDGNSVLIKED